MHLLEEMESAGLEAYPPAHHVAISAVAAADGYKAALDVLNSMKVGRDCFLASCLNSRHFAWYDAFAW